MFTDIHTHILPGVDDGPKTLEESEKLLQTAVSSGILNIVATPHFYPNKHSLPKRLELINQGFNTLKTLINAKFEGVNLCLGMEVRYYRGISKSDAINTFCFENSKIILLELGYEPIDNYIAEEILELFYCGYTVVLAHIERYYKLKGLSKIKKLIKSGFVKAQVNAASLFETEFSHIVLKLIKSGMVSFLASDMHSVELRPPKIKEAFNYLEEKIGGERVLELKENSNKLFSLIKV